MYESQGASPGNRTDRPIDQVTGVKCHRVPRGRRGPRRSRPDDGLIARLSLQQRAVNGYRRPSDRIETAWMIRAASPFLRMKKRLYADESRLVFRTTSRVGRSQDGFKHWRWNAQRGRHHLKQEPCVQTCEEHACVWRLASCCFVSVRSSGAASHGSDRTMIRRSTVTQIKRATFAACMTQRAAATCRISSPSTDSQRATLGTKGEFISGARRGAAGLGSSSCIVRCAVAFGPLKPNAMGGCGQVSSRKKRSLSLYAFVHALVGGDGSGWWLTPSTGRRQRARRASRCPRTE